MAIVPSLQAMESVSQIMAKTLQNLHKFIPQLLDKLETLEKGLGDII